MPGWKIVIFTDRRTLIDIEEHMPPEYRVRIKAVLDNPDVIVGVVVWPEYDPIERVEGGAWQELGVKVENAILRVFRLFSCLIFSCPSFVRDADTTFSLYSPADVDHIIMWESEFYRQAMAKGIPFIFATQIEYYRGFHKDPRLPENKAINQLGTYAGMFNFLGPYGSGSGASGGGGENLTELLASLWNDALSYIRGVCHIVPKTGLSSNTGRPGYIGKDEQILVYVWLPQIMDRTFFFYYNFVGGDSSEFMYWYDYRTEIFRKALEKLSTTPGFERAFKRERVRKGGVFGPESDSISLDQKELLWPPSEKLQKFWTSVLVQMKITQNEDAAIEDVHTDWLAKGWIDEGDPIADKRFHIHGKNPLHNPYSVIEAFRNPKYDTMLRVITESFQKSHRVICRLEGIPTKYVLEERYAEENAEYKAVEEGRRQKIAAALAEENYWRTFRSAPAGAGAPAFGPNAVLAHAQRAAGAAAGQGPAPAPPAWPVAAGAAGGQGPAPAPPAGPVAAPFQFGLAPQALGQNQMRALALGGGKRRKSRKGSKKRHRKTHKRAKS